MKKQNNRGLLSIQISDSNQIEVIFQPVNNIFAIGKSPFMDTRI